MLINLRNALMGGKRLPYDSEVEFLESSGTQYIDTGVVWESVTTAKIEATVQYTQTSGRQITCGASTAFYFGCNANRWEWAYSRYAGTVGTGVHTVAKEISTTATNFYIDGALAATLAGSASQAWWGSSAYAFGLNNGGSFVLPSTARLYSLKIWIGDALVFDGIPVRKGTVGYLYDRVSGKLFGNAGTGDFVLGQDVVPVEYIESTGTQYINPQVSVASGDSFALNMRGLFTGTSSAMQLHGVNGGAYFGLQTNGNYTVGGQDTGVARDSADHAFALSATIGNSQVVSLGIDGNTYTRTRNNSAGYIGLFNLLDASTSNPLAYYSKFRMKDASIAVNGATVRTMKPVRVGTEGAMMDVLTRRIYRNQGTGAFTYGNDLKYPIPAS